MRRLLLTAVLVLLLPALANAQALPAFTQTDTYSNIGWGVNTTRGWSFTVTEPIVVEQLGFWDSGQDGLASVHDVGLWRGDETLPLFRETVPSGTAATLDGTFRWVNSPWSILWPGITYVVGAYWSQNNPDTTVGRGENVVFDSRVSLVEGRGINTLGLAYPVPGVSEDLSVNFKAKPLGQGPTVTGSTPANNAAVVTFTSLTINLSDEYWPVDAVGTAVTLTQDTGTGPTPFGGYTRADGTNTITITITEPQNGVYVVTVTPRNDLGRVGSVAVITITDAGTPSVPLVGSTGLLLLAAALLATSIAAADRPPH